MPPNPHNFSALRGKWRSNKVVPNRRGVLTTISADRRWCLSWLKYTPTPACSKIEGGGRVPLSSEEFEVLSPPLVSANPGTTTSRTRGGKAQGTPLMAGNGWERLWGRHHGKSEPLSCYLYWEIDVWLNQPPVSLISLLKRRVKITGKLNGLNQWGPYWYTVHGPQRPFLSYKHPDTRFFVI